MSPLHKVQSDFQAFLLHGDDRIQHRVMGTEKVSIQTRLGIYHDAYRLRLIEALDSNYPVLHAWIGDEAFEKLSLTYLEEHPSKHFSIRYFGHRLAEYLAITETYRDQPFLSEMAKFEWALSEAFDAEDSPIVNLHDMASIPPTAWPEMRLAFHASWHRLELRWNVPAIWKAINQYLTSDKNNSSCRGETNSALSSSEGVPDEDELLRDVPALKSSEHPQSWLIWRQGLKTYFRSLSVDEATLLDAARAGNDFAALCERLCEWIDAQNVASHAAGLLKQWVTDGLIQKIEIS